MSDTEDNFIQKDHSEKNDDDQTKSTNDNEDTYYNRATDGSRPPADAATGSSNEQNTSVSSPLDDVQDWKCRECGFVNNNGDTACETCDTPKPMRPLRELRLSARERSPSPVEENIYNRADTYSSDEDQDHASRKNTKQTASPSNSSREQSPSDRDENRRADNSNSEEKNRTSDGYPSNDRSSELSTTSRRIEEQYDQYRSTTEPYSTASKDQYDADKEPYQMNSLRGSSKRKQSRSPSPTTTRQRKSPDAIPKEHSPSYVSKFSDGSEHKQPEDDYQPGTKNITSSTTSVGHGSREYGRRSIILYPNLDSSSSSHDDVPSPGSHKDREISCQSSRTEGKSFAPSTASPSQDDDRRSTRATTRQSSSQSPSASKIPDQDDPIVVYIPDLPVNIDNGQTLGNMIRECLEHKHRQKVQQVECFTQFGVGVVFLNDDEDKNRLIHVIGKTLIEPTSNTTVSFVDKLDLSSYVVIHTEDMKNLPLPSEISRRWFQLYHTYSEPRCEQLCAQFPNIFRIVTHSLEELLKASAIKDFSINNRLATVYFQADCCFLEDLPRTTNPDRLQQAISQQISDRYMSKELVHIQYNKDAANAVVLTSGRARVWSLHSSFQLDGRMIMKKDQLACRLLIRSVPKDLSTSLIRDHKIFGNSVVKTLASSDHVIFELSDRNVYEKCIDQGALRINDKLLGMEPYTFSSNPEDSDIDAETWYETEMCDYKPDIMTFMSTPQHPIFRWKWNPEAFLIQFRRWTSKDGKEKEKDQEKHEKLCNLKRHLLRMTVMLNTIGVVKRDYYRIGEKEIKLKVDRLKTILYDHKSKLQRRKTIPLSQVAEFPHASTAVRVVNEDCLIVYKNLVSKGYRPVILNMANATNPGGGYKRGDGAQEETLFRRSNYYQSLDMTLDDGKPSARFYCNSNCEVEPLSERGELYPMGEFGAIYTSGLTVFRLPEETTGYKFMDIPMYDVCGIAMAAYRDPKMEKKDLLAPKFSIGTRKKIENIFAIAHQHKHDCLVLSALGCGAFRNPPTHVAKIFKSVIEQYAGYFKCIYFSIIDDHNTGQDFNPHGNYRPFQKILDNLEIRPKRQRIVDTMIGPWRILNQPTNNEVTLSNIRICYLPPCHYGGKCENIKNEQHCREYSHPPLCPNTDNATSCKEKNDDQHMLWFRHRQKCHHGGECELVENDPTHSNEFEHPEYCRDGGRCENMEPDHLKSYRHVSLCRHRRQCVEYNRRSEEHCRKFRHCIPNCRFGAFCVRFNDEDHFKNENHPYKPPCPFTPFHCRDYTALSESQNTKALPFDVQNHCLNYSHVCRFGRQCREQADVHWLNTIHIARKACPYGDQCKKTHQEDYLNSYSHPDIADIRRLCNHHGYECLDRRKPEHIVRYRHHGNHDRTGVISWFGQNKRINFFENQANIIKAVNEYAKGLKTTRTKDLAEIHKLVKAFQPVHRCGKVIFESILVHGHVMSRGHMEHLKKPAFVAQAVQEHKRVRAIFDRYKMSAIEGHVKEYILAIVSRQHSRKYSAGAAMGMGITTASMPQASDDHDKMIHLKERILRSMQMRPEELDTISKCARDIAEASWNLHSSPTGIGYEPDKALATDKHVFSILGPHLGHYYGDIVLVFKSEIMLHPDANFSPQAATSFSSRKTFGNRPWSKDPGTDVDRVKCFHESKLHCSIPGYEHAAAAELIAITGLHNKTMDVSVKDIFRRWKKVDSHEVFEAHLPQLVPLDYIEEIYIPKSVYASLTPAAQESAKKIFRDALHITRHDVNPDAFGGGGMHSLDKTRSNYQDYVTDKLIEKFEKQMERTRHLYGSMITLAPSRFTNHIVLPLTITGAYDQYRHTHKHASNSDDTYIYWQAMYGDMMVTLSNEKIDSDTSQPHLRCLVCYIAERPSTSTANYNESYTYLNAGDPYRHDKIMIDGQCSKSSRSFHRGCNTDDFITYCLKLDRKTGQVTLSHAGPNAIYCYQTISCNFSKTALDLNRLKYIHVSAGSQKVPIRNLVVSFEQIADLHPTFDENFKRGDDPFPHSKKSQARDRKPSPVTKESPDEKSPSLVGRVINVVGSFLGYNPDGKKLEPCPYSVNCQLQESAAHMKEHSHPCPYSELCRNQDKEPYLTHEPHRAEPCPSKSSCDRLEDVFHRAKYRHTGYPDFLTPCRDQSSCKDKTPTHRTKYSHGETVKVNNDKTPGAAQAPAAAKVPSDHQEKASYDGGKSDQLTPCRYGSDCRHQKDAHHCSKYSHSQGSGSKPSASPSDERTPCRYGSDCRDQHDFQHRLRYSHPQGRGSRPSESFSGERTLCRYGSDCRDQNDSHHRARYSHPQGRGSRPSEILSDDRAPCRYGSDCRNQNDFHHRSKYSHPKDQRSRDEGTPCKFGHNCYDMNPHHRAEYSHPHK